MDDSGLGEGYSDLSQEEIMSFCSFRSDVNLLRAQNGQESVRVEEAMKCLKASQFNAARAVDLYKNYQKYIVSYRLDNLRPHREPLCSGIGSRKMEVVGTVDSEGSSLVLFTASRHETVKSNHKFDMQLLFYTLDQAAKSKDAQENGLVFIFDMRDVSADLRFTSSAISVLKDVYPLHTKSIYLIFNGARTSKTAATLQKMAKSDDVCKVKVIHFSELTSFFSPDQLPLSLEGTFTHTQRFASAARTKPLSESVAKDDLFLRKPLTSPPLVARRGSGGIGGLERLSGVRISSGQHGGSWGRKTPQEAKLPSAAAEGGAEVGGRKVNRLLEVFQSSCDHPSSSPVTTTQPVGMSGVKPTPPANKPARRPANHIGRPSPAIPVKKPLASSDITPAAHKNSHSKGDSPGLDAGEGGGGKKIKVPLIPFSGGGRGNFANSSSKLSFTYTDDSGDSLSMCSNEGTRDGSRFVEGTREQEKGEKVMEQRGRGEKGGEKKISSPKMAEEKDEGASSVTAADRFPSKSKLPQGGILKKMHWGKLQQHLVVNTLPSTCAEEDAAKCASGQLSTSWNSSGGIESNLDGKRRRADSVDTNLLFMTPTSASTSCPKKRLVPLKPIPFGESDNESLAPQGTSSSNPIQKRKARTHMRTEYENVLPSQDSTQLRKARLPAVAVDQYQNVQYCNRDSSDIYENMDIGFAGHGGDISAPLPPIPPSKEPVPCVVQPPKQGYENVIIKKPHKKLTKNPSLVEDDDETLFGEEGPPGKETIYENFGPDEGHRKMRVEELEAYVEKVGQKGLATEYFKIRNEPLSGARKICRLPCNISKNRYKDVICYDKTRVQLSSIPGKKGSDYINASYVDGFNITNAFILTQGPKDSTVPDFWRMIWEQHVLVIVMVTKCVEVGKRKCAQYWPDISGRGGGKKGGGEPQRHGDYMVAVANYRICDGYDLTMLQVEHKGMERILLHFQFLAWPDYGIPSSGSSILHLIFAVRRAQADAVTSSKSAEPHPIVVHCSAGVGRSGAFCSIDTCIWELDKRKSVNYQGVVRQMRKQRAYSVQTEEQYEFGYRTLLEYARNRDSYDKLIHIDMQ